MTGKYATLHLRLALMYAAAALLFLLFASTAHANVGAPLGQHMYYRVGKGDDFYDIAQKFDIGIGELRAANPRVNEAKLKAGQILVLPTAHIMPDVPHEGIVINLPERRLYYFDAPSGPMSFPVTVGKEGWETPMGVTSVVNKRENPTWTVPDKIRAEDPELPAVVPPGPDNPLGQYAMDLGFQGIRIHGTNNPKSIGRQSSHGCIRMYPADIEKLFNLVPVKTKVTIINQPYKLGWLGNNLMLEVAPPAAGSVAREVTVADIRDTLNKKLNTEALVDWDTIKVTVERRDGMPVSIGRRAPNATAISQAAPSYDTGPANYVPPPQVTSVREADVAAARAQRPVMPAFTPYTAGRFRGMAPPSYDNQNTDYQGSGGEYSYGYGNGDGND